MHILVSVLQRQMKCVDVASVLTLADGKLAETLFLLLGPLLLSLLGLDVYQRVLIVYYFAKAMSVFHKATVQFLVYTLIASFLLKWNATFELSLLQFPIGFYGIAVRALSGVDHQDLAVKAYYLITRKSIRRIREPELIHTILRDYSKKGDALERRIALPAWSPVRSLESVDDSEWETLHGNLMLFMPKLPPISELRAVVKRNLQEHQGEMDSLAISRVTIAIFMEYLFGRTWEPAMELFVQASLEWRRELALRSRGDKKIKAQAVELLLSFLRQSSYWSLFGELWTNPLCYSIVLQPFLISPAINFSDIFVTVSQLPDDKRRDIRHVLSLAHPFPIMERFVDDSRMEQHGIPTNTHVFMFASDLPLKSVFGAGKRVCSGVAHASAFFEAFVDEIPNLEAFVPAKNHRYSGRDNDKNLSLRECVYFVCTVLCAIVGWT